MRILRFLTEEGAQYGILEQENEVRPLACVPFDRIEPSGDSVPMDGLRLLAPCVPTKIVAVGLNYKDHAEEFGLDIPEEPMLFMKPATAVVGPEEKILLPEMSERVDYEGELAVVIGRKLHRAGKEEAEQAIFGYTCFNDVTARDLQAKDIQFTRAKSFDTFAPMGPWIETDLDPSSLTLETLLNGELTQCSNTSKLAFDPLHLVHFVSWIMTLLPGDVIATGTPSGIGPMQAGDLVEVRIQGIGSLINPVATF